MTAAVARVPNHYVVEEDYGGGGSGVSGMIQGSALSPSMTAASDPRINPQSGLGSVATADANNTGGEGSSSVKNAAGAQQMQTKVPTKRPVRRGVKQPPDRPQRALFFFTLKNPIRKICISIVEWKYPFCCYCCCCCVFSSNGGEGA